MKFLKILNMSQRCALKCVNDSHPPILLLDKEMVVLGRSAQTQIQDPRCSRKQIELLPDFSTYTVRVTHVGANPGGLNSDTLRKGETAKASHGDLLHFLTDKYTHRIEFSPPPSEDMARGRTKRSANKTPEKSPKKKARSEKQEDDVEQQLQLMRERFKDVPAANMSTLSSSNEKGSNRNQKSETAATSDSWKDIDGGNLMIYTRKGVAPSSKISAYDIDGTIITTKSGKVFPVNKDDWQILYPEVPGKLKQLHKQGYKIVFITNQLGISKGRISPKDFKSKVESISSKLNVPLQCLVSIGKGDYRKPGIGMWRHLVEQENGGVTLDLKHCMYIGDAAGRQAGWAPKKKKDFSSSDRLFAMNIGIPFYTPEEHFQGKQPVDFKITAFSPCQLKNLPSPSNEFIKSLTCEVPEVIILVGFPGAGKSHFFKTYLQEKGYIHANRDKVGSWQKCVALIKKGIAEGKGVVVDNTNPDIESRKRYIEAAKEVGASVRCFIFETSLENCKHNNRFRELTDKNHVKVNDMIFNMYRSKYVEPTKEEGFTEVKKIPFTPHFKKNEQDLEKLYFMFLMDK